MTEQTNLNILFNTELEHEDIEKIREKIEDSLGVEILEISENAKYQYFRKSETEKTICDACIKELRKHL